MSDLGEPVFAKASRQEISEEIAELEKRLRSLRCKVEGHSWGTFTRGRPSAKGDGWVSTFGPYSDGWCCFRCNVEIDQPHRSEDPKPSKWDTRARQRFGKQS